MEKVSNASECTFMEAARKIFTAKISGTFSRLVFYEMWFHMLVFDQYLLDLSLNQYWDGSRRQLACGKRVLTVIDAVQALARKVSLVIRYIFILYAVKPKKNCLYMFFCGFL